MQLIKRLIRYLAGKNYYTAKALWKRDQQQLISPYRGQPIITYQMGKVGSSTVQASLVALDPDRPVYHVHFLNPKRVKVIERQRLKYFNTEKIGLLRRPWLSEFLFDEIQKKNHHWKIITLVREPIARNISTFFENLEVTRLPGLDKYAIKSDYYGFELELDPEQMDPLIELFFDKLVHDRPLKYFEEEIKIVFDIDVYGSTFPKDKGHMLYQNDAADMLLVRLEDLDRCAKTAFKELLDVDDFTLIQTNVAEEKVYATLYKEFKNKIRFTSAYVNRMYESNFVRHFYTDEEIEVFRKKWKIGKNSE